MDWRLYDHVTNLFLILTRNTITNSLTSRMKKRTFRNMIGTNRP